ncbi:MAG TPA: hypothetical protein VK427_08585 [Kofleriaceae bacterium]|nr:hypothetical protein [Kofleriaceae bacterium]
MLTKTRLLATVLGVSLALGPVACSSSEEESTDRWAATANTNVKIDWDKVNDAYKNAEGPEDLEKRLNEIYEGDEIISVHVQDLDDKTQVVTGFFDKDSSGTVEDPEKIFTIRRELKDGSAQYQTQGHGHYAGYHSPFFSIASGMLMGAMLSSMFMPSYSPMYRQPYTTSQSRVSGLHNARSSYRAANPDRFQRRSQSGRSYGGGKSTGGTSRSRGGSRFGVRRDVVRTQLV